MVQCEMCGAETSSPRTVKVEGAELEVCGSCASFGTEVRQERPSSTSTKYSTGSSGAGGASGGGSGSGSRSGAGSASGGTHSGGGSRSRRDPFADLDTLATDYPDRIRGAREDAGLSQDELADQLNEKASLIRKLERGDIQPSDDVQRKLERSLDISLTESGEEETPEWEGGASTGEFTLGDVVTRKDS